MKEKLIKVSVFSAVWLIIAGIDIGLFAITIQAYNLGIGFVGLSLGISIWISALLFHGLIIDLSISFWQEC